MEAIKTEIAAADAVTGCRGKTGWRTILLFSVAAFALAVFLQKLGGAYDSEFGGEPDEAAHYVTGLCVRDYLAAGCPGNPLRYAQNYYNHYPKVALGHWPPFFYVLQSGWTLPFGASRISVLLLMALLAALTATLVFAILKTDLRFFPAAAGAALFLALPLVQIFSGLIMTEIPIALMALGAAIFYGRFLDCERTRDAAAFGLLAAAAILTKQSALFLAGVPVLGILATRKFHLLKRPAFWLPAGIVALLCGPWTLLTLKLASEGAWADEGWGWAFTRKAIPFYLGKLCWAAGVTILLLAIIGLVLKLRGEKENARRGLWVSLAALLVSVVAFHMVMPVGYEARHLIPALPAVVVFAVVGAGAIVRLAIKQAVMRNGILGLMLVSLLLMALQIHQKGCAGFGPVAEAFLKVPDAGKAQILISSDARGEGMFISELAMRERRPGHVVRRGSKELARSSWSGGGYAAKFSDDAALVTFLRTNSIQFVALDDSLPAAYRKNYHDLILLTAQADATDFKLIGQFPVERAGNWHTNGVKLYRLRAD